MTLGEPWFLLLLLLVPVLLWRMISWRTKGRVPVPTVSTMRLIPSLRGALWWVPDALRILAVLAVIAALVRPRVVGAEVRRGEGVAIMLVLDMSRSMYAVDMPAKTLIETLQRGEVPKNRFEVAREVLKQFVVERNKAGADQIGLVVFGQEAWVRYPLTHDHARLVRSLTDLVLDQGARTQGGQCSNGCTIDGAGTAIGDALRRAYSQLQRSDAKSKIMVLITDGKEMGGSTPAASIARHLRDLPPEERMRAYTFQVGGKGEMYVPQIDRFGRQLKTAAGLPAYEPPEEPFPIDPDLLREIADATGGKYYESYSGEKFKEDVADLARTAFQAEIKAPEVDVFELPLLIALGLFLLEWALRMTLFRSVVT